jgi:hypothetical protein
MRSNEAKDGVASEVVSNLSQSRRLLAPLAMAVGGVEMLFSGMRGLISNWRLLLVQALPVLVIWWTTYDLKAHVLATNSLPGVRGPILVPIGLAIIALTTASFFLNSVFAFAVTQPATPEIRPAIGQARGHMGVILGTGTVLGLMLALAMTVISRTHGPWFTLALGIAIAATTVGYVAVPARLLDFKPAATRRDKLSASVLAATLGVAVAAPPYLLGRVGVLMLGVHLLFIPGLAVVCVAGVLEAAAAVTVKAIRMTSKLVTPMSDQGPPRRKTQTTNETAS